MHVWVPYPEWVADVESVGDDVQVDVFTGENEPPASIDEVAFYVAPYSFTPAPLQLTAKMPSLRVLQLLTAGFESALPHVPEGLGLQRARCSRREHRRARTRLDAVVVCAGYRVRARSA